MATMRPTPRCYWGSWPKYQIRGEGRRSCRRARWFRGRGRSSCVGGGRAALCASRGGVVGGGGWRGGIGGEPRGSGGFGYDPVFLPQGWYRTAAELSAEEKDSVS